MIYRVRLQEVTHYIHMGAECGGEVVPYSATTRIDEETGDHEVLFRCHTCGIEVWVTDDNEMPREIEGMADRLPGPRCDPAEYEKDEVPF